MSPTLLELALGIFIVCIAWQIGLALAPTVLRQLRAFRRELDEAANAATDDHDPDERPRSGAA